MKFSYPKLPEKPSALKKDQLAPQKIKNSLLFSISADHFCPPRSGFSNSKLMQIHADPDPFHNPGTYCTLLHIFYFDTDLHGVF
jgi:hypothetical protein